jgi:WD40 repeat protein
MVLLLGLLTLTPWPVPLCATAGTPAPAALYLLRQVRDHYQHLSSFSMRIEHENSSGLFPGRYRQTLQWRRGGRFALLTLGPAHPKVPDYHADGKHVVWLSPSGMRFVDGLMPDQGTAAGWEVSGGPILSWLQHTPAGNDDVGPEMEWRFGPHTRWHGLNVRELSGTSRDRPDLPGESLFIDESRKLLLGYENRSQGEPGHPGWALYQNQKLGPSLALSGEERPSADTGARDARGIEGASFISRAVIDRLNELAALWVKGTLRATWQGGLVLLLVWLGCRVRPSLPAGVRCWLWRLAYLKLLVAFFWPLPVAVSLPLLPAPPAPSHRAVAPAAPVTVQEAPAGRTATADPASPPVRTLPLPQASVCWLALWLVGLGVCLARMRAEMREVRSLYCGSYPLTETGLSGTLTSLCQRLRLRREPAVRAAPGNGCPSLLGLRRPVVLLPETLLSECEPRELEMVLAHELAHLKRWDLAWGGLAVAVQSLFFFYPMVWLAAREWQVAQESACDELAIRLTRVSPADYGALLVSVAARHAVRARERWVSVGVLETYQTLTRRLSEMRTLRETSRRQRVATGAFLATLGVLGLVPWRVAAQKSPPGTLLRQMPDPRSIIRSVAFSPDGSFLAGTGINAQPNVGHIEQVHIWDPETGVQQRTLTPPRTNFYEIFGIAFSPDGKILAVGGGWAGKPGEVTLWDPHTGELKGTLTGHDNWVNTVAFSPDGSLLASGSVDGSVKLWDTHTGMPEQTLTMESGGVWSVAFSPDGKTLAGISSISTSVEEANKAASEVRLWDLPGGTLRTQIKEPQVTLWSLSFSPDGTQLATAGDRVENGQRLGILELRDPKTAKWRNTLTDNVGSILRVAFSPDGRLLATTAVTTNRTETVIDGEVAVRDAQSGALIWSATGAQTGSGAESLAFSPDSQKLAVGCYDSIVRLWQAE